MRAAGRAPKEDELEPLTWALAALGRQHSAAEYLSAWEQLQRQSRRFMAFFSKFDLWLTPTVPAPPPLLGCLVPPPDFPLGVMPAIAEFAAFTPIANITGQPAMSLPLFWNAEGLPIGVQFLARAGEEAALIRLASQLEQVHPWAGRWPALALA